MDRNTEMILFENVMDAKETVGWMIANATSGYNLELLFEKGVDFKTIRKVLIENQKKAYSSNRRIRISSSKIS